jgi:flavin reductase ActVB
MTVDAATFREALAHVPTSVSVITTIDRHHPYGVTVGSLCSLSLTPPLLLFCLDRNTRSHRIFSSAGRFLVNVLRHDQQAIAHRFATAGVNRFRGPHAEIHSMPVISGALAWLLCSRYDVLNGGDHSIVLGLVEQADVGAGRPLLYYDRSYHTLQAAPLAMDA